MTDFPVKFCGDADNLGKEMFKLIPKHCFVTIHLSSYDKTDFECFKALASGGLNSSHMNEKFLFIIKFL